MPTLFTASRYLIPKDLDLRKFDKVKVGTLEFPTSGEYFCARVEPTAIEATDFIKSHRDGISTQVGRFVFMTNMPQYEHLIDEIEKKGAWSILDSTYKSEDVLYNLPNWTYQSGELFPTNHGIDSLEEIFSLRNPIVNTKILKWLIKTQGYTKFHPSSFMDLYAAFLISGSRAIPFFNIYDAANGIDMKTLSQASRSFGVPVGFQISENACSYLETNPGAFFNLAQKTIQTNGLNGLGIDHIKSNIFRHEVEQYGFSSCCYDSTIGLTDSPPCDMEIFTDEPYRQSHLIAPNLGTIHHAPDILPTLEKAKPAIHIAGALGAVLHGTTHTDHQVIRDAVEQGCCKINFAGEYLHAMCDAANFMMGASQEERKHEIKKMDFSQYSIKIAILNLFTEHVRICKSPLLNTWDYDLFSRPIFMPSQKEISEIIRKAK